MPPLSLSLSPRGLISEPLLIPIRKHSGVQLWSHRTQSSSTADPRIHETPNLDSDPEFPDSESRFSQLMYLLLGLTLVHKLTESKFGIRKLEFGIGIEIGVQVSCGDRVVGCGGIRPEGGKKANSTSPGFRCGHLGDLSRWLPDKGGVRVRGE